MNAAKSAILGLLAISALLLGACSIARGSGKVITEARDVSDFDRVELSGSGDVILTQGETESLTVETDDNIMQYVTTSVRGRTLYLGMNDRQFNIISPTRLVFTLQVQNLTGLDVSGSGSIDAGPVDTEQLDIGISGSGNADVGELTTDQVKIDVSGSGSARIDALMATQVDAGVSGSGNVQLAGEARNASFDISGSGNVRAGDLRCSVADVKVNGSGAATVWAVETLDVDLSGSGSVSYYGQPSLNSSTSGSGSVRSLGAK